MTGNVAVIWLRLPCDMTTNVRPKFSNVSSFSVFMFLWKFWASPNFSNLPFFSGFHIFPEVLGTHEPLTCHLFSESHFFLEFLGTPEFLKCPVFSEHQIFLGLLVHQIFSDDPFFPNSRYLHIKVQDWAPSITWKLRWSWNGQKQDIIEHRGHQIKDPNSEINTPGSKYSLEAKKSSKNKI